MYIWLMICINIYSVLFYLVFVFIVVIVRLFMNHIMKVILLELYRKIKINLPEIWEFVILVTYPKNI